MGVRRNIPRSVACSYLKSRIERQLTRGRLQARYTCTSRRRSSRKSGGVRGEGEGDVEEEEEESEPGRRHHRSAMDAPVGRLVGWLIAYNESKKWPVKRSACFGRNSDNDLRHRFRSHSHIFCFVIGSYVLTTHSWAQEYSKPR